MTLQKQTNTDWLLLDTAVLFGIISAVSNTHIYF